MQEVPGPPGLPRVHHIRHAMLSDPGEAAPARHCASLVWISASETASSFPCFHISRLNHFSLSAYGLPACCSTLNSRGYPLLSKNSLPGSWLNLPGRASHPLKHATLPGRTSDKDFGCVIGRGWPKKAYPLPAAFPKSLSEKLYPSPIAISCARSLSDVGFVGFMSGFFLRI